ncbi:MAG: hypothetical protein WKF88_05580 [Ferruginibacter sp.]
MNLNTIEITGVVLLLLILLRLTLGPLKSKSKPSHNIPVELIRRGGERLLQPDRYEEYYNRIAAAADTYTNVKEYHLTIKCIQVFQNTYSGTANILFDVQALIMILERREFVLGSQMNMLGLRC